MKALVSAVVVAFAGNLAVAALNPIPGGVPQALSEGATYNYGAAVTYTPSGTTGLTVLFAQGATPPATSTQKATVLVDDGVQNSAFKGDYVSRSANTIQFALTSSGYVPGVGILEMKCAARSWLFDFTAQVSAVAGEAKSIVVPLTVTGWRPAPTVENKDAAFAADLQSVVSVSIILKPTSAGALNYPAQSYTIDSCVLVNDDGLSSEPGLLTPLERGLIGRFGFGHGSVDRLTDAMKMWDADGDGMFDFMEIWSENDPAYAESIFTARSIKIVEQGVEVTWTCVGGSTYTVLRAASLGGTFLPVTGLSGIVADQTGYMSRIDSEAQGAAGPFYYRIRKN